MRRLPAPRCRRFGPVLDHAVAAGKPRESAWLYGFVSLFRCRPAAIRRELSDYRLSTSRSSIRGTHLRNCCGINAETSRRHGQLKRCGRASRLPLQTLEARFIQSAPANAQTQAKEHTRAVARLEGAIF